MRSFILFCTLLICGAPIWGQMTLPIYPDSIFATYYQQRFTHFQTLPQTKEDIIFLGNSITDGAEWSELFQDIHVKNRGISGDFSAGIIHRLGEITHRKAAKVFLLIGINDLSRNVSTDSLLKNIFLIANYIHREGAGTQLFIQSLLPVNDTFHLFNNHTNKANSIKTVNESLQKEQSKHHYTFLPLHDYFCNSEGKMNTNYSNDGLHLNGRGYLLWKHLIYPYVYGLNLKPSLIPQPKEVRWDTGYFSLAKCNMVEIAADSIQPIAKQLQDYLQTRGKLVKISSDRNPQEFRIMLQIDNKETAFLEEGYRLKVSNKSVLIQANTLHGLFNGIQTLKQLMRDDLVDACNITDAPAFGWRGYMVDVGRNYQSMVLLKQQIDIMGSYKLNIFHFHPTEDIAWRLAIKGYPQLTAPKNMERNKGMWYTEKQIKELIDYCKRRFIQFVPEIDMPGHSAAFQRAMHLNMQSDSGLAVMKKIMSVFFNIYDVDIIHIGGDEVKIDNPDFLPQISDYIHHLGKKTIGWLPGGNLKTYTIRQLWEGNAALPSHDSLSYIDSRHLYLNHMDPLESVTTIFNRQIGNKKVATKAMLGGEICLWNDRSVASEADLLLHNPVYPAMLTFAERAWAGGGNLGWIANIGVPEQPETIAFTSFEHRLLDHKKQYFKDLSFPYVKQTDMVWNFYGSYKNDGDLLKTFPPENTDFDFAKNIPVFRSIGGTQVLRHWWFPLIKGAVKNPGANTTWYAHTTIWSDTDTEGLFWIGFNNLSRSTATDSPEEGTWNNLQSWIRINGKIVAPPIWQHAGIKGNIEIPLMDEGYEYRIPTSVPLHYGWNAILIKLPVASFKGKNRQNPVKWMFTCVRLDND